MESIEKKTKMIVDPANTVMTPGIKERCDDITFLAWVTTCLIKHCEGDWSHEWNVLCKEDIQMNEDAIATKDELMSAVVYPLDGTKVYIITDAGWEVTTILLPEEY